jgi:hypothetical protein
MWQARAQSSIAMRTAFGQQAKYTCITMCPWALWFCAFGAKMYFSAARMTGNGRLWLFPIGLLNFFLMRLMLGDPAPFWATFGCPYNFF